MTINLEHTADENTAIDRNFEKLKSLVIDTGGESVGMRFGIAVLTYTAAAVTPALTVTHGLGVTPECILALPASGANRHCVNYVVVTRTDTTFDLISETVTGAAISGNLSVFWLVIG